MKTLYIIVPCYNEEECLPGTSPVFLKKVRSLMDTGAVSPESRVLFVDDGSADGTWELLKQYCAESPLCAALRLSQNRGHQNAVMTGLMVAKDLCDITVTIDADLQDDINAIDEMVKKNGDGYPIVCGVRSRRNTDRFLKRFTARAYYRLMNLLGAKIIFDHADFRLMDKIALERLSHYHGEDLFLRGLATRLGLPIATVYYDRTARMAGDSKYTLHKMMKLALKGFTCGRMKPLDNPRPPERFIGEALLK